MGYNYPYGQSAQLNLDWLIKSWREFQQEIEDMIAPAYSETATYPLNSLVIYKDKLWTNTEAIADPEAWDPEHWTEITLAEILTS